MSDDVTLPRREVETVLREHAFYKASAEKLEAARDAAALDLPALLAEARADAQDAATRAQAHSSDITAEAPSPDVVHRIAEGIAAAIEGERDAQDWSKKSKFGMTIAACEARNWADGYEANYEYHVTRKDAP